MNSNTLNDRSWGERLLDRCMRVGLGSMSVIIVVIILAAVFSWWVGSPILETILKVLGITILFLICIAIIAFIEFLQKNDIDGDRS